MPKKMRAESESMYRMKSPFLERISREPRQIEYSLLRAKAMRVGGVSAGKVGVLPLASCDRQVIY